MICGSGLVVYMGKGNKEYTQWDRTILVNLAQVEQI